MTSLDTIIEKVRSILRRISISPSNPIKPHKQMSVIVLEDLVMDVMISRSSQAQCSKDSIPWKDVFGMYEYQPISIHGTEGHVGPYVTIPNDVGGGEEW